MRLFSLRVAAAALMTVAILIAAFATKAPLPVSAQTVTYTLRFLGVPSPGSQPAPIVGATVWLYAHGASQIPANVVNPQSNGSSGSTDANGFLVPAPTLTIGQQYDFVTNSPVEPLGTFTASNPTSIIIISPGTCTQLTNPCAVQATNSPQPAGAAAFNGSGQLYGTGSAQIASIPVDGITITGGGPGPSPTPLALASPLNQSPAVCAGWSTNTGGQLVYYSCGASSNALLLSATLNPVAQTGSVAFTGGAAIGLSAGLGTPAPAATGALASSNFGSTLILQPTSGCGSACFNLTYNGNPLLYWGTSSTNFQSNVNYTSCTATSGTTLCPSYTLTFDSSAWNGTSAVAGNWSLLANPVSSSSMPLIFQSNASTQATLFQNGEWLTVGPIENSIVDLGDSSQTANVNANNNLAFQFPINGAGSSGAIGSNSGNSLAGVTCNLLQWSKDVSATLTQEGCLDQSGNLGINGSFYLPSASSLIYIGGSSAVGRISGNVGGTLASVSCNDVTFYNASTKEVCIDQSGNVGVNGNVFANSSRALKRDIGPLTFDPLSVLTQTNWLVYCYKDDAACSPSRSGSQNVGFIAEDTSPVLSGPDHNRINAQTLAAVDAAAIVELRQEVKRLEIIVALLGGWLALLTLKPWRRA